MQAYQLALGASLLTLLFTTLLSSAVLAGTLVTHNGKPIFPIGIYHYPEGLPLGPRLEELARAGFNAVLSPLTSSIEFMDDAAEHGIGVIATLGWNMILDPGGEESKKAWLRENIERLKDHPALLGYEAPDEIAWVDFSDGKLGRYREGVLKGYDYVKSLDPDHPIYMNHAPRNTVEYLKSYSEGGDILGTDIYPVPEGGTGHSDLDPSLNCVGQYTEKLEEVGGGKPIYMVLQGFAWEDLSSSPGGAPVQPNWLETRFMAYDAVCHGANGIIYWGMAYSEVDDEIWDHLKRIAGELRDLTPVLLNSSSQRLESENPALELHLKVYQGYHYLFVLNTNKEALSGADVGLPEGWNGDEAFVLFENRSLNLTGEGLVDTFQPYEVHIYTDDPRPDVEIDVVNPQLLELGKETKLAVKIRNGGHSATPPLDLALRRGGEVLTSLRVQGLDAMTSRTLEMAWIPLTPGQMTLDLSVELPDPGEEWTQENNRRSFSLTVSPAGPDLTVGSVTMPDQETICAEVVNSGLLGAAAFNVSCTVGPVDLTPATVTGLAPGESYTACWTLPDLTGTRQSRFVVDGTNQVEEMLEDNNQRIETLYLEDLIPDGPLLRVRGLENDNLWLIKYNATEGGLPDSPRSVSLVWGLDDWRCPNLAPWRTLNVQGRCESPMELGIDGLWYTVIPNQDAEVLMFNFKDSQSNVDDNEGRSWRIYNTEWVLALLAEYQRLVDNGTALGVNMSDHEMELSDARDRFAEGNYTAAVVLAEGSQLAGVRYVSALLQEALYELEAAKAMGMDMDADERKLFIAGKLLESGKYAGAEDHCLSAMEHIAEEVARIPEGAILFAMVPILRAVVAWRRRRLPSPRGAGIAADIQ